MTRSILALFALGLLAALPASADPTLPAFDPADFSTPGVNAYFPLTLGTSRTLAGAGLSDGETVSEAFTQVIIGPGPQIMGVATLTMLDEAFVGGVLVERALDYFAADAAGNIWYFGEDVENLHYDDAGVLTGTDAHSSWRAGVDGALPGLQMPAMVAPGGPVFQEYAAAQEALDYATIAATGQVLTLAGGTFDGVIQVEERSMADLSMREFKYYAPGIGLIRTEEGLGPDSDVPALTLDLLR